MAVEERVCCDRCGASVPEGAYATLRSLEHVLKTETPMWRIDLCTDCYVAFRKWMRQD